jgi:membrane protease YdiL (CAAX protease family)
MSDSELDGLKDNVKVGEWEPADLEPDDSMLPSSRVPTIGHALLFFSIAGVLLLLSQAILLVPKMPHGATVDTLTRLHPKLLLATEAGTYILTLAIAWFVFPLFWARSFLSGLDWNGSVALRHIFRLIPLGIFTGWAVQGFSSLISMPKTIPMDDFFRSTSDLWIVSLFGTLLAPLFEEICFRGFLLPAFAIAADWLGPVLKYVAHFSASRLRGQPPPEHFTTFHERRSAGLTPGTGNLAFRSWPAIILASLISSALFGLMHAQQLGYTWAAVLLLTGVSLLLTVVRIRTRSLACSAIVHGSYNLSVFLVLFIATDGYRHLDRMIR